MKSSDKERIIRRYDERLEKFGATIEALASGNIERHNLRFKISTEVGIQNGDTILDLGCGFADYYQYLAEQGFNITYSGYDINPSLIEKAIEKFPQLDLQTKDILQDDFPTFDYIVSSSCFNLPLTEQDNYEFIAEILQKCYEHAEKGVAIDFNSSYVDFKSADGFHYEPERVFSIAKKITKRVSLRHDYPLFEFAIYMYKDFKGWR
ncbi:class I SAM-dependent methyltransferase [Daejeonella sp. JGW-45]|uniref:class I SAM-dependent methyltransferase n=1 Tax=Daejeonella sp. JGW-45 TaxID=3034148 RepID=UPI0023EBA2A3|nr:class I SAM-dependent methyltransferase [Daejeonella sp. JGW-45]